MTPTTAHEGSRHAAGPSGPTDALALASVASFALLWKLGAGSLAPWDEAIYAQVSKEVAQGGDWLTPRWGHQPWFEKPPLLIWITAIFYRLFGVGEFWARAASAFSGVGVVVLTYLTGRLAYDRRVGLLAASILLASYHFLSFARFGTTDVMLTLFTLLSVYGYLRLRRGGGEGWWHLVWLSIALALMLKGAGGLIAPAVIALALALDGGLGGALRSKHFWLGGLLALAAVAPWHVLMYARHGRAFTDEYFGYHVLARLKGPLEGQRSGYLYYVARLVDGFFPWCLLAPFAFVSGAREGLKGEWRPRVFLAAAALVLVAFTLTPTRRPWYVVPAYPALAILVASFVARFYRSRGGRGQRRAAAAACGLLLALGGAYSVVSLYLNRGPETPLAKLSRRAASAGPADREPLVVFSDAESTPAQVPLFYSDRPVRQAYSAARPASEDAKRYVNQENLADVVGDSARHIILSRDDAARLSADYDLRVLAEDGPLVYATIRRKD